jgi:hypothetical protein
MKKLLISLALMLFAGNAFAEEYPEWFYQAIKKDNPSELAYYTSINGECSFTKEEAKEIIEGVFVRSRVKPLGGGNGLRLYYI